MNEQLKTLQKLVKFAQKHGISYLKMGEIELKFDQTPKITKETSLPKAENDTSLSKMPSDSDMLMWSTPSFEAEREN